MQPEMSHQQTISLRESSEPNSQLRIPMRCRFGEDSFSTARLNNAMDDD
jgi:hypothetical protein